MNRMKPTQCLLFAAICLLLIAKIAIAITLPNELEKHMQAIDRNYSEFLKSHQGQYSPRTSSSYQPQPIGGRPDKEAQYLFGHCLDLEYDACYAVNPKKARCHWNHIYNWCQPVPTSCDRITKNIGNYRACRLFVQILPCNSYQSYTFTDGGYIGCG